jgi:hypothetical protein
LIPIEIKLGTTAPDTKSLVDCMRDLGSARGYVVNLRTDRTEIRRGIVMTGLAGLLDTLRIAA